MSGVSEISTCPICGAPDHSFCDPEHEIKVKSLFKRLCDILDGERKGAAVLEAVCVLHVSVLDYIIGQWAGDKVSAIEREIIETHRRLEKTSQGTGNA